MDKDSDTEEIYEENKDQIQEQLEKINDTCSFVNSLQKELEECDSEFNTVMAAAKAELISLRKRIGSRRIEKATPYYKQLSERNRAQDEAAKAAQQYQRSLSELQAAKETLELAEVGRRAEAPRDEEVTWQEYLSLMRQKVVYAEQELERSRYEHRQHSKHFRQVNDVLLELKAKHERSVEASRAFFELKLQREQQLTRLQQRRQELLAKLGRQKQAHKEAMTSLEAISSDMHMSRRLAQLHRRRLERTVGDQVSITLTADSASGISDCSEDAWSLGNPISCQQSPAKGRIVSRVGHVTDHPLCQPATTRSG